jgi:hypothetical protein
MKWLVAVAALALLGGCGTQVAAAPPSVVRLCSTKGWADEGPPTIRHVVAENVPAKTSGYMPRCAVAGSVAGYLQSAWQAGNSYPKSVTVMGARWFAGKFVCVYTLNGSAKIATCSHGRERVTMNLGGI